MRNKEKALIDDKKNPVIKELLKNIKKYWRLYIMIIPAIVYFIIFKYIPLLGTAFAFTDVKIYDIWSSTWVGLKHFERLITYPDFWHILRNTLLISLYNIVFTFPIPIALAILINEIVNMKVKKIVQTFFYIPYFLSWVIISGIFFELLSTDGLINIIRGWFGAEDAILFMQREEWFRPIIVLSSIWRDAGWNSIIFLAAITGIDMNLYEAARVDGANKFQQIIHITLPSISTTIVVLLLIRVGNFLELGFDQLYNFLTPMTYSVGEVFSTYVYRVGILESQYGFATAVGVFQSLIGLVLIISLNKFSMKLTDRGIF